MKPLPTPCLSDLMPGATDSDAFSTAYRRAKSSRARCSSPSSGGGRAGQVKADVLTAPQHSIGTAAYDAVREAIIRLIRPRQIRPDSSARPVYSVLHDVDGEPRVCELATALHAAALRRPRTSRARRAANGLTCRRRMERGQG